MKTADHKPHNQKDLEQLGRALVSVYESGYLDAKKSYKNSFFKGVVSGLGGVLGATVCVAILIWILSFFSHVPLIGRVVDNFRQTITSTGSKE